MRLSDETLRGRTVIASDGLKIGQIVALFLNSDGWRVESIQVKLPKDVADRLGAGRSMFHAGTVEIPIRMVQSVGDAVVLSAAVDELRQVLPDASESPPAPKARTDGRADEPGCPYLRRCSSGAAVGASPGTRQQLTPRQRRTGCSPPR
jgi:sporulation protein YlmC with PRC-barrel domain